MLTGLRLLRRPFWIREANAIRFERETVDANSDELLQSTALTPTNCYSRQYEDPETSSRRSNRQRTRSVPAAPAERLQESGERRVPAGQGRGRHLQAEDADREDLPQDLPDHPADAGRRAQKLAGLLEDPRKGRRLNETPTEFDLTKWNGPFALYFDDEIYIYMM